MQPEDAIAMRRHGFGIERDALRRDGCGQGINVLAGGDPEGQALAPCPIQASRAVVLAQEEAYGAGLQGWS